MVANLAWNSSFIHTTFQCSFLACGPTILFKAVFASSKVAFVASIILPWKFQVAHE
jgi:hypothetical protein